MSDTLQDRLKVNYEKGINIGQHVLVKVNTVLLKGVPVADKLIGLSNTQKKNLGFNQTQIRTIESGCTLNHMDLTLLHVIYRAFGGIGPCRLSDLIKDLKDLRNTYVHKKLTLSLTKRGLIARLAILRTLYRAILEELKSYCHPAEIPLLDVEIADIDAQLLSLEKTIDDHILERTVDLIQASEKAVEDITQSSDKLDKTLNQVAAELDQKVQDSTNALEQNITQATSRLDQSSAEITQKLNNLIQSVNDSTEAMSNLTQENRELDISKKKEKICEGQPQEHNTIQKSTDEKPTGWFRRTIRALLWHQKSDGRSDHASALHHQHKSLHDTIGDLNVDFESSESEKVSCLTQCANPGTHPQPTASVRPKSRIDRDKPNYDEEYSILTQINENLKDIDDEPEKMETIKKMLPKLLSKKKYINNLCDELESLFVDFIQETGNFVILPVEEQNKISLKAHLRMKECDRETYGNEYCRKNAGDLVSSVDIGKGVNQLLPKGRYEQHKKLEQGKTQNLLIEPSTPQQRQEQTAVEQLDVGADAAQPSTPKPSIEPSLEAKYDLKNFALVELSKLVRKQEHLEIQRIEMMSNYKDEINMVEKLSFGWRPNKDLTTKVILLVGSTGSGKTTLINSMVNYVFNVEFTDPFRFILIDDNTASKRLDTESQTDYITSYAFNHKDGMNTCYNCVVIDTPGFGDTRGIKRDRAFMRHLEEFLNKSDIDSIDAIGFVTQSSEVRLTERVRYIFDSLYCLFGKDIKENIFVMTTFATHGKPKVLESLKNAGIECKKYYKFNNSFLNQNKKSALKHEDEDDESDTDSESDDCFSNNASNLAILEWDTGYQSMKKFFKKLCTTKAVSLKQTKEVLNSKIRLEDDLSDLQKEIKDYLSKLQEDQSKWKEKYKESERSMKSKDYIEELKILISRKIYQAHERIKRLDVIALKPYSLSFKDYICSVIKFHEQQNDYVSFWHLDYLENIKKNAMINQELMKQNLSFDDFISFIEKNLM